MLHRLLSDIATKNIWVEQSKDYIFKHLHEKIRIQDIAEYLHLNANYLSELFRQCENVTLTDFILQEKVKLTRNLLAYSPYSYIEIATYLGFSSQSRLGKVFKKYTGMTLRQYRGKYGRTLINEFFSLLCHSIHSLILIQHLRMILFLNLDISQQLAYTTIAKGKYIIIVCS